MFDALLRLNITDGPLIVVVMVVAVAVAVYLLVRKPTPRWMLTAALAVLIGSGVAFGVLWLVNDVFDTFGMRLSVDVALWAVATFAGVSLAIVNLWRSRWWRKTIAGIAIPVLLIAGTLGINASFGLDPTVGAMFGVTTEKPIQLAAKPTAPPASATPAPVSQPL
ncbi:MAG: esterase, partial [Leifsonia sp.]